MTNKVKNAEFLGNLRVKLEFENGETRYLKSDFLKIFIDNSSKLFHNYGGMLPEAGQFFIGNKVEIDEEGGITLEGHHLSADEAYEKSSKRLETENLSEFDYQKDVKEKRK